MIAALPMYDRAETAAAHDTLWQGVRAAYDGDLPPTLSRDLDPAEGWARADLALGQICGLPLRTAFRDRVAYVGSGVYDIDASPGYYRSVWVVRRDDPRGEVAAYDGATLAISAYDSQSGWAAPVTDAGRRGVRFNALRETGAHAASAAAVAAGGADIAALDAVSWRAIGRHEAAGDALRVIDATPPTPGLAFVTAPGGDTAAMFAALTHAIAALDATHRSTLGLQGIVRVPLAAYHAVPTPPRL